MNGFRLPKKLVVKRFDEKPPFLKIMNSYNPKGFSEDLVNLSYLRKKELSIIVPLILEYIYGNSSDLQNTLELLKIMVQYDVYSVLCAPYIGVEVLKNDPDISETKLYEFIDIIYCIPYLSDRVDILLGRFVYEYIGCRKDNILDLYICLNHFATIEPSKDTTTVVSTGKTLLKVTVGIIQYFILNVMLYDRRSHTSNIDFFFSNNKMVGYLDDTIVNIRNLSPYDLRTQVFSGWNEKSGYSIEKMEINSFKNLMQIEKLKNPPLTYVKAFTNCAIITENINQEKMLIEHLIRIHSQSPNSYEILNYCVVLLLNLSPSDGLKLLWKFFDTDPCNSFFDAVADNLDFDEESNCHLYGVMLTKKHLHNFIKILFKRLTYPININNVKNLRLLIKIIKLRVNDVKFLLRTWSKNVFAWSIILMQSDSFYLSIKSLKLRTSIQKRMENISSKKS